jgi:hypothetical protein
VTVDELVRGVDSALSMHPISACPGFGSGQDGMVSVDEIVNGLDAALNGCLGPPGNAA